MCTPGISCRVRVQGQRAHPSSVERRFPAFAKATAGRPAFVRLLRKSSRAGWRGRRIANHSVRAGFTLIELLVVIGIIALLLVLIAPAFTYIKGGTDVTGAAYTIKGVLDTARTYAKANDTYTWVGFFEENAPDPSQTPAVSGTGRIVMSTIASKDGTMLYTGNLSSALVLDDPPNQTALIQVSKLTKVDNVHLKTFQAGTGAPPADTFDTRPAVASTASQIGNDANPDPNSPPAPPNPALTFHYPLGSSSPQLQYTFQKVIQFSPRGEGVITNLSYSLASVSEIGVQPTHANATPEPSPVKNPVAIQFSGLGGSVKIYRK